MSGDGSLTQSGVLPGYPLREFMKVLCMNIKAFVAAAEEIPLTSTTIPPQFTSLLYDNYTFLNAACADIEQPYLMVKGTVQKTKDPAVEKVLCHLRQLKEIMNELCQQPYCAHDLFSQPPQARKSYYSNMRKTVAEIERFCGTGVLQCAWNMNQSASGISMCI